MTTGKQLHFFATADDVHEVLSEFEGIVDVKYVLAGMFKCPDQKIFTSQQEFADLGITRYPNAISGTKYIVVHRAEVTTAIPTSQMNGTMLYAIDQRSSPNNISFMPSAIYENRALLYGKTGTILDSEISLDLYRALTAIVRKRFTRVKEFWVGTGAAALLDSGFRLTMGADSPTEYDLKRE